MWYGKVPSRGVGRITHHHKRLIYVPPGRRTLSLCPHGAVDVRCREGVDAGLSSFGSQGSLLAQQHHCWLSASTTGLFRPLFAPVTPLSPWPDPSVSPHLPIDPSFVRHDSRPRAPARDHWNGTTRVARSGWSRLLHT